MFKTTLKDIISSKNSALDVFNKAKSDLERVKAKAGDFMKLNAEDIKRLEKEIASKHAEIEASGNHVYEIDNTIKHINNILGKQSC
jgi:peptidoglycan hydrolase CwlO-like protein